MIGCHAKSDEFNLAVSGLDSVKELKETTAAFDTIYTNSKIIKQGDLIMRTGKDFTSETMRRMSLSDKTYSHCGIASIEHDSIFVYHSIGGEWNPDQKLRRDPFEVFCNPYENRGFGIFRYYLTPQENSRLLSVVKKFYKMEIKFDMQFDLVSDERMYCSEFVYKSVEAACHNRILLPTTILNHVQFVAPDNLYTSPACEEIKRITFNSK